jgi:hypothetical protein
MRQSLSSGGAAPTWHHELQPRAQEAVQPRLQHHCHYRCPLPREWASRRISYSMSSERNKHRRRRVDRPLSDPALRSKVHTEPATAATFPRTRLLLTDLTQRFSRRSLDSSTSDSPAEARFVLCSHEGGWVRLPAAMCHSSMALCLQGLVEHYQAIRGMPASQFQPLYTLLMVHAAPGRDQGPVWGKYEIAETNDYHSRNGKLACSFFALRTTVAGVLHGL